MEERTRRRPRIADVAREAGVSKTAVSFAFNSPDRLAPETASRIRTVADSLGYRPHPVARMLTQRATRTIGVLTPQALSVIFSNPFFGAFSEGVALAAEQEGYALHFISPLHGSLARAMDRATVDGAVAHRPVRAPPGGRAAPRRRAAAGHGRLERPARPADGRDRRRGRGARRRPSTSSASGIATCWSSTSSRLSPGVGMDFEGVGTRRMRGYLGGARGEPASSSADAASVVAPATIEGGIAALRRAWEDGLRPDRRARDVGRDGDRRPARRPRARPARPARTCPSSGSTTSTSASTRTRRSPRSTSRSA